MYLPGFSKYSNSVVSFHVMPANMKTEKHAVRQNCFGAGVLGAIPHLRTRALVGGAVAVSISSTGDTPKKTVQVGALFVASTLQNRK